MTETRARILYIDDDVVMHEVVELMLAGQGYELTCCLTGAAGLEVLRRYRFQLVLLDIMLTEPTEGLQVACRIRQDPAVRDVPIIFVSAVGEKLSAQYAREICPVALGADLFLEKPLDAATLREAVRGVLEPKGPRSP